MKISILCSSKGHPIYPLLESWAHRNSARHAVELVTGKNALTGGDILFLISCHEVIDSGIRGSYVATLVIHASDLPVGRGWSPHVWQVLEGKDCIMVTLLEAEDQIDSGDIWAQREMILEGHELYDEINEKLFSCEMDLMDRAVTNFGTIVPRKQDDRPPSYYPKRSPEDSRLDPQKPLAEQFELLRVADSSRFPAFFDFRGHRYHIHVRKEGSQS